METSNCECKKTDKRIRSTCTSLLLGWFLQLVEDQELLSRNNRSLTLHEAVQESERYRRLCPRLVIWDARRASQKYKIRSQYRPIWWI